MIGCLNARNNEKVAIFREWSNLIVKDPWISGTWISLAVGGPCSPLFWLFFRLKVWFLDLSAEVLFCVLE